MAATFSRTVDSGLDPDSRPVDDAPSSCPRSQAAEFDDEQDFLAGDLRNLLDREALGPLLETLTLREKQILVMRFHRTMTQSEIGLELDVSQMQVSRLLTAILGKLRAPGTS